MSFFSDLFGGNQKVTPQLMQPQWQQNLGTALGQFGQTALQQYNPAATYPGQLSTTQTPQGAQTGSLLTGYLNNQNPLGPEYTMGINNLNAIASGSQANPATSPLIQALTALSNTNLQNSINTSRANAGARGNYYSTPAMNQEQLLRQGSQETLNSTIGSFIQNAQNNMLTAAGGQINAGIAGNAATQGQIQTGLTYDTTQQAIQQANLEAQYQSWLGTQNAEAGAVGTAASAATAQLPYVLGSVNVPTQGLLSSLSPLLSLFGSGGSGGTSAMSGLGSALSSIPGLSSIGSGLGSILSPITSTIGAGLSGLGGALSGLLAFL